jgi:hypothetical protein
MADYSFSPQFANLSGLQPLPALDVTRGAALQFQPLQAIQVQSSRPELVAEGIAGAVSNIAQGALSGITARYEKAEAEEERKLKFAQEIAVAEIKAGGDLAKERREFIARNAGDARLPEMLAAWDAETQGVKDRIPSGFQPKKDIDSDTVTLTPVEQPTAIPIEFSPEEESKNLDNQTTELPNFEQPPTGTEPIQQPSPIVVTAPPEIMPTPRGVDSERLAELSKAEPKAEQKTEVKDEVKSKALSEMTPEEVVANAPQVDYTKYPKLEMPVVNSFRTEEEAMQNKPANMFVKDASGNLIKNPDYDAELVTDSKNWKSWKEITKRKDRIDEESKAADLYLKQADALNKGKAAQLTQQEKAQKIQIGAGKVKNENRDLANQVEAAATSMKELNEAINILKNNKLASGSTSKYQKAIPFVSNDAKRLEPILDSIKGDVSIKTILGIRSASPTGAGSGSVSDYETKLYSSQEGSINQDLMEGDDLLKRLESIRDKRMKIFNNGIDILKKNNPEYVAPEITYSLEKSSAPEIKSKSDYDNLPVGSKYIFEGEEYIKE